jgi:phytoene synthase
MSAPVLSPVAELVRAHDPDRFLTALFASPDRREALFTLYAFNHELARAREAVSQPTLALIRLHWWREVVEGADKRHEVATPLAEALAEGRLPRAPLLVMIAGREAEAEDAPPTVAVWRDYLDATAGALCEAAGFALAGPAAPAARLRALGTAYGVAGVLRSVAVLARQGRCLLPEAVLAAHGTSSHAVTAGRDTVAVQAAIAELAATGRALLAAHRGPLPRQVLAAALPAVLARRDLRRPGTLAPRGLGDRLAVLAAALTGRV